MKDQSPMMNQHQVLSDSYQVLNKPQLLMNQSQLLRDLQILNQPQLMNQQLPAVKSQPLPPTVSQLSQQQVLMSHMNQVQMVSQGPVMGQNYGSWTQFPPIKGPSSLNFANPMVNMYGTTKPGRNNWKRKKPMEKSMDDRRNDIMVMANGGSGPGPTIAAAGGMSYKPPTLQELEQQNRLKARRFYARKKHNNRMAPYVHGPRQRAPRNTTSFIIRAKRAGGIASLVSPYPVTPAVLPTPVFSPSREALVDMAKEEWGVDGYGTMKGLIRLRSSPGHETEFDDYEDEDEGGSSESDVEEHLEVERRLDHDLSRFEMIYPDSGMENRVHDQDKHIAQLEEENLLLKDRLYLVERDLGDLRRRLQFLERRNRAGVVEVIDEFLENVSENESELHDGQLHARKSDEEVDSAPREEEVGCFVAGEGDPPSVDGLGNLAGGAKEEVKGRTLEVEQKTDTKMKERVLKESRNTGVKVEELIDNNRETLEHEAAGELGMEDSDMPREDAAPDKRDDDKDFCAAVEGKVEGSGEASSNEQIKDLQMEDLIR